jgi:hypothetical protein
MIPENISPHDAINRYQTGSDGYSAASSAEGSVRSRGAPAISNGTLRPREMAWNLTIS